MPEATWEPFWTIGLLMSGLAYLLVLNWVRSGLRGMSAQEDRPKSQGDLPSVSVIIPCRNEAEHIGSALHDLASQDYPVELLQVLVVDDRSTDGTGDIVADYAGKLPGLILLRVETCPENVSPKKHAILKGLKVATGEVIVTTDGDCRFQPGWIRSLIADFAPDVGVVTGLTIFNRGRSEPFWQRLQQLDYLSHSFFAAGAIGKGLAFNCNGSNLALRRRAFEDVGGYDQFRQVVTGDDTLLIQRIRHAQKWRIHFNVKPEALVRSWPEETPEQVFNQRLRWGSGGLSYSPGPRSFALLTFAFFLMLLASPLAWGVGLISTAWVFLWALKIIQEGRVMASGWKVFGLRPDWPTFAMLELVHVPAILIFSIGGHLFGFRWKGERFKRARNKTLEYTQAFSP